MDNQEDLARIQEFTLKSNFAAPIEESVHKILYEATFYKGLGAPKVDTVVGVQTSAGSTSAGRTSAGRHLPVWTFAGQTSAGRDICRSGHLPV